MSDPLVIWTGPIAKFQVPGATVPGVKELFIRCTGNGQPNCPTLGAQLREQRPLGDPLYLGAFSAGGSVLKRLMMSPEWRQATRALMLSDAMYTAAWLSKKRRLAPPIEGFVKYGVEAATRPGKLMVATASPSPNKNWPTGVENLRAIRREIELRTTKPFTKMKHFFGIDPAPEIAYRLGNTILAEYAMYPLGHGGHTKLAQPIWQRILIPWLQEVQTKPQPQPQREQEPGAWKYMVALTALATAIASYLLFKKSN